MWKVVSLEPPFKVGYLVDVGITTMESPFFQTPNMRPFTLESLRRAGIFGGVVPDDQGMRRNMMGNSVASKRIGEPTRYDVTGVPEAPRRPIKLYATRGPGDANREYINSEFVVMFLRRGGRVLAPEDWHLQVSEVEEENEVSRVFREGEIVVEVAEMTHVDMVQSGHWAVLSALKHHQFEGLNSDFTLWSHLHSMVAYFEVCRNHRDNAGEQAAEDEGAILDRRRVRRRV